MVAVVVGGVGIVGIGGVVVVDGLVGLDLCVGMIDGTVAFVFVVEEDVVVFEVGVGVGVGVVALTVPVGEILVGVGVVVVLVALLGFAIALVGVVLTAELGEVLTEVETRCLVWDQAWVVKKRVFVWVSFAFVWVLGLWIFACSC